MYFKLNKHRVKEIRYIFKMRIGCDGSREVMKIRRLLQENESELCHLCQTLETREHILT